MENRTILLDQKSHYGKDVLYAANDLARLVCKLTKKDAISLPRVRILQEMGFEIEIIKPESVRSKM